MSVSAFAGSPGGPAHVYTHPWPDSAICPLTLLVDGPPGIDKAFGQVG
jgi:hypothetical protein